MRRFGESARANPMPADTYFTPRRGQGMGDGIVLAGVSEPGAGWELLCFGAEQIAAIKAKGP